VALTADHGMNDKPRVVFLEDELCERFGGKAARVICPITDPFVRHHGALGSFVRVYARSCTDIAAMMISTARAGARS
jgi:phosphonoacetate hydrolase